MNNTITPLLELIRNGTKTHTGQYHLTGWRRVLFYFIKYGVVASPWFILILTILYFN